MARTFADKLRSLREAKGIARREFAKKLGVSLDAVIHWEHGDRVPPLATFQDICKALEVPCTEFDGHEFARSTEKRGRGRPKKPKG